MNPRVVLDTNVLGAALRSDAGASYRVVQLIGTGRFDVCVSVPLVCEYEAVLKRGGLHKRYGRGDIDALIDFVVSVAHQQRVFYLWRPFLRDPKDDMVLELAVAARSPYIVTFNTEGFGPATQFGITIVKPAQLLHLINEPRPEKRT